MWEKLQNSPAGLGASASSAMAATACTVLAVLVASQALTGAVMLSPTLCSGASEDLGAGAPLPLPLPPLSGVAGEAAPPFTGVGGALAGSATAAAAAAGLESSPSSVSRMVRSTQSRASPRKTPDSAEATGPIRMMSRFILLAK